MAEITKFVGFKLNCKDFVEILDSIELSGKDISGGKVNRITSFIIFVGYLPDAGNNKINDNKCHISTIVKDENLIMNCEITPLKLYERGEIPVEIEPFRKKLKRFKTTDDIECYYDEKENMIVLRRNNPEYEQIISTISMANIDSTNRGNLPVKFNADIPSFLREMGETVEKDIYEEYVLRMDIETSELSEVLKDSDEGSVFLYPLVVDNGKLYCSVKNERGTYKAKREIVVENPKFFKGIRKVEGLYSSDFYNLFNSLTGKVRIYMTTNAPIFVVKEGKNYTIKAYLWFSSIDPERTSSHKEEVVEKVE